MDKFEIAFFYLLGDESRKYTNDPDDPGGPTKYGITLKAYQEFLGYEIDASVIENLDDQKAEIFYRTRYWNPLSCDKILDLVKAVILFDAAVLYGTKTLAIMAQKAANALGQKLIPDGAIGPKSIAAINASSAQAFVKALHQEILDRDDELIAANPVLEKYRHGWKNRADRFLLMTPEYILTRAKLMGA